MSALEIDMVRLISTTSSSSHSEALSLLRQSFPDIPLARRVAACAHLKSPRSID